MPGGVAGESGHSLPLCRMTRSLRLYEIQSSCEMAISGLPAIDQEQGGATSTVTHTLRPVTGWIATKLD